MNKLFLKIQGLVLVIFALFLAYKYNESRTIKISELSTKVEELKYDIKVNDEVIFALNSSIEFISSEVNTLDKLYNEANVKNKELQNILAKHDLKELAYQKPGLIQKRINSGVSNVNEQLRELTK